MGAAQSMSFSATGRAIGRRAQLIPILLLCGCAASAPQAPGSAAAELTPIEIQERLYAQEQQWHGAPHKNRGDSAQGVDAPTFVRLVFEEAFGLSLPRAALRQLDRGVEVGQADLTAGDLVFFRPTNSPLHVGIYLSNGEFAHASPAEGVTISRMDAIYWSGAFWTARRLTLRAPAEASQARPRRRSGW